MLWHTFGRSLLGRGVGLVTVQQLMGHKQVDSAARYTKTGERGLGSVFDRSSTLKDEDP